MTAELLPRTDANQNDPRAERNERTTDLLRAAANADTDAVRQELIDEAVVLNLSLAESIAWRYAGRGIDRDDLTQVAYLGLVNAARRFDPAMGKTFGSFALPTITGEVKRHFRDHGWTVRPPRRIQELQATVNKATTEIAQQLGTTPTTSDLAEHLDIDIDEVLEASASHECFTVASIDYRGTDGDDTPLAEALGMGDAGYDHSEAVVALAPACSHLRERDRRILYLRFFLGWTQQEIGGELGVTQMQVSRLLTRILGQLRNEVGAADTDGPDHSI